MRLHPFFLYIHFSASFHAGQFNLQFATHSFLSSNHVRLKLSTSSLSTTQEPITNQCSLYFPKSAAFVPCCLSNSHHWPLILQRPAHVALRFCKGNNHVQCILLLLPVLLDSFIQNNPYKTPLALQNTISSLHVYWVSPTLYRQSPSIVLSHDMLSIFADSGFALINFSFSTNVNQYFTDFSVNILLCLASIRM